MQVYRIYFCGLDGHIIGVEVFECQGDAEAIEHAREMAGERPIELWQQARKVAILPSSRTTTG